MSICSYVDLASEATEETEGLRGGLPEKGASEATEETEGLRGALPGKGAEKCVKYS